MPVWFTQRKPEIDMKGKAQRHDVSVVLTELQRRSILQECV